MNTEALRFGSEADRLASFRSQLDALHARTKAKVGQEDLDYIRRVDRISRAFGWAGRGLIALTPGPIGFGLGVVSLFVHKQLQATEVGHTVLHGAFDKVVCNKKGADHEFRSEGYEWGTPIHEGAWRLEHNVKHHQYTNIVGRDPDTRFGRVRLNPHVPYASSHRFQFAEGMFSWLSFTFWMNTHATGLTDVWLHKSGDYDVIDGDDPEQVRGAYANAGDKIKRYYLKEFVLWPLLTGPFFFRSLLGNVLSEVMRDLYSAATIWCGHVGEDTEAYAQGTKAGSRDKWYEMQVRSANNFEVSRPVSMLCGALDRQIEHHLFPKLPTQRLREIGPEVREICEQHEVPYRTDTWGRTLFKALKEVLRLQRKDAKPKVTPADARPSSPVVAQAA